MDGDKLAKLPDEEKERRKQERKQKKYDETHKMLNGAVYKLCVICKDWYLSTDEYFYKNKSNGIDGLHPYCKKCTVNKTMKVRNSDKEYWYSKRMESYYKNKNYYLEKQKEYDYAMRDEKKIYLKIWQQNNKDKIKEYNSYRMMHKSHEITKEEWESCKEFFNNSCAYCGIDELEAKKVTNNYLHKEHVDHQGSNGIENCVPACKSCNSSKHTSNLEDWYNESNSLYSTDRLNRIIEWLAMFEM